MLFLQPLKLTISADREGGIDRATIAFREGQQSQRAKASGSQENNSLIDLSTPSTFCFMDVLLLQSLFNKHSL